MPYIQIIFLKLWTLIEKYILWAEVTIPGRKISHPRSAIRDTKDLHYTVSLFIKHCQYYRAQKKGHR